MTLTEHLPHEAVCREVHDADGEPVRVAYELTGGCLVSDGAGCAVAP